MPEKILAIIALMLACFSFGTCVANLFYTRVYNDMQQANNKCQEILMCLDRMAYSSPPKDRQKQRSDGDTASNNGSDTHNDSPT